MTLTTCTTTSPVRAEQVCHLVEVEVEVRGPVGHDFPFEICCSCGFPILPADLAGDTFRHWHDSTCTPAALLAAAGGERQ